MFQLSEVEAEARKILGACSDEKFFHWCFDAVQMLSGKIDLESLKGYLDLCVRGCSCGESSCRLGANCGKKCLALPREVQTILSIQIGGRPTLGFAQNFSFHLNGPGDCRQSCDYSWEDKGAFYCTYRDLITPARLVTHLQSPEDNGKEFTIFGFDIDGNVLRREVGGVWMDGLSLPTIYGVAVPEATAPLVARITGITKSETAGSIRLATTDSDGQSGVNLGTYFPDEKTPQFRRVTLNRACSWVRIAYTKTSPFFKSRFDHVPLTSRLAFILAVQARKAYAALDIASAHSFEADAARLEGEQQMKLEAPLYFPIQIVDRNSLKDRSDHDIR